MHSRSTVPSSRTAVYRLVVAGPLGDRWAEWFGADSVEPGPGTTEIIVAVADQAELLGRLRRLQDLNLHLLELALLPSEPVPPHTDGIADPSPDVRSRDLAAFLLLTFAISWGLIGLLVAAPETMTRWFGPLSGRHPLFILAVWAPAMSAGVVVVRNTGFAGLRRFLGRLRLWRAPFAWWVFLVLGLPAVFHLGALLRREDPVALLPEMGLGELLVTTGFMLILGPVEEFGWRGVALPILQRRMAPLWAGLVVGLIWSLWHVPAFVLAGTLQSGWSFTPFMLGTVAASVIMTGLMNASRGSLLIAALFHFQMINPVWPDARPWDSILLVVVAVAVVVHPRASMLGPGRGVERVVPVPENSTTEETVS